MHSYPFDQDYFYDAAQNDVVRWEQVVVEYKAELLVGRDTLLISNVVVETSEILQW